MAKKRAKNTPKKKRATPARKTSGKKPIEQLTTRRTEADLEGEIRLALRIAFPWLRAEDLKHQVKFSIKVGHAIIPFDGEKTYRAQGRADIIVEAQGEPVAVMELKRPGNPLTSEDGSQGLSYARLLEQMPPLVVITNGTDVRWLETHTRKEWEPSGDLDGEFKKLVDAAGRAAAVDVKEAVQTLLGTRAALWVPAVRQATSAIVDELSGAWSNQLRPFVPNFLIPRDATRQVLERLRGGARAVVVSGAALAGKSNVVRELAVETEGAADFAVLFIEADGPGPGIFQRLANLLGATLAWPVSADEVRTWVRRLSKAQGPALVLALDGPGTDSAEIQNDLTELCSDVYGKNVRLVLALDDTVVRSYTLSANRRKETAFGRIAEEVGVMPLNDAEFSEALRLLWDHRVGFIRGVMEAAEMRAPWVLRATVAGAIEDPNHQASDWAAILPPLLGLNLIGHTRKTFTDPDHRRRLREVAKALLDDIGDEDRTINLKLEAVGVFLVRNGTLEKSLHRADIDVLLATGILKRGVHESGDSVVFVRMPELLASELARLIAEQLARRLAKNTDEAAHWLAGISGEMPLGDIIAAQAVFDTAASGVIRIDFINALLNVPPSEEPINIGTRLAMHVPGFGIAQLDFQEDGSLVLTLNDKREVIEPDDEEPFGSLIADVGSWLILSHLASRRFIVASKDSNRQARVDPLLLLEIGTCPYVLRGSQNDFKKNTILVHEVPGHGSIVCHKRGIVEPVTMAISRLLAADDPDATAWVLRAVELKSFPLLMRVLIALQQIGSAYSARAKWAKQMLDEIVKPALNSFPLVD